MSQAQSALTRQRVRSAWMFLTPMLIILCCVAGWPLLRTIYFSFTDAQLDNMRGGYKFIGLENYFGEYGLFATGKEFIQDKWAAAISNTLKFSVISVTLETIFGVIVALVLNAEFKGRAFVRAAVLIPWAIPTIVSAKMWSWMLNDQYGVINYIGFHLFGMEPKAWVAESQLSFWSVIFVDVWKTTPFMALLVLAALQMLPKDCYEAAQVDGINPVKVFFKVTLPLIKPALMVAVIFRLLDALRIFDLIYVLTSNSESTISMSGYVRQEMIDNRHVGTGSAAATVLFLVIGLCTVVYMKFGKVKVD